jgi:TetR/AcrR family transcriptional regulator, cholesterol catabolism regulator
VEQGGVRERKQAERRARVIQAAMHLAREGGYDAVQMREVSARADVALGTIYRYFASKDEILAEGLVRWVESLRERIAARPRRGNTVGEQVGETLRAASRVPEDATPLLRALMTAMSSPSISVAEKSRELNELMRSIVREAIGTPPPPGVDVEGVCRVVAHVWSSGISQWVGGVAPIGAMGDDLALAARLLLDR